MNLLNGETDTMNHIYWIGGSSCSGKSFCAKSIAEKNDFTLYNTDYYAFGKYMFGLENIQNYPAIEKYKNLLCEGVDSFIHRDIGVTYNAFIDYCHEVFPFLQNDIAELSKHNTVIIEGAHVLPELLFNYYDKEQCLFLISSEAHQRTLWLKEMNREIDGGNEHEIHDYQTILNKKDFEITRIGLHQKIAEHIQKEAMKNGLMYIAVNNDTSKEKLLQTIQEYFKV